MFRSTIATGAGTQHRQEINLGKEIEVVTFAHRAGLHEILARIAGETRAHEHVQHIVHAGFGFGQAHALIVC